MHLATTDAGNDLLDRDPLALLTGMLLDQQIPMEKAFTSPSVLLERLGGDGDALDAAQIAALDPDALVELFRTPPALHRFPGSMAARVQELCRVLVARLRRATPRRCGRTSTTGQQLLDPGGGAARLRRAEGADLRRAAGQAVRRPAAGWREAAGDYGEEGSYRSVADVVDAASLLKVRSTKQEAETSREGRGRGRNPMTDLAFDRTGAPAEDQLEQYRLELTGYCYRMLGSAFEAEDAVQDTMVRAWRALDRSSRAAPACAPGCTGSRPTSASTRSTAASAGPARWTSGRPSRRPRRPAGSCPRPPGSPRSRTTGSCRPTADPADLAVARDSVRLAFIAALQHLPPRQRAVLILREVLAWSGGRRGRAARHDDGVGQQRAPAGPRHAWPSASRRTPTSSPS